MLWYGPGTRYPFVVCETVRFENSALQYGPGTRYSNAVYVLGTRCLPTSRGERRRLNAVVDSAHILRSTWCAVFPTRHTGSVFDCAVLDSAHSITPHTWSQKHSQTQALMHETHLKILVATAVSDVGGGREEPDH